MVRSPFVYKFSPGTSRDLSSCVSAVLWRLPEPKNSICHLFLLLFLAPPITLKVCFRTLILYLIQGFLIYRAVDLRLLLRRFGHFEVVCVFLVCVVQIRCVVISYELCLYYRFAEMDLLLHFLLMLLALITG